MVQVLDGLYILGAGYGFKFFAYNSTQLFWRSNKNGVGAMVPSLFPTMAILTLFKSRMHPGSNGKSKQVIRSRFRLIDSYASPADGGKKEKNTRARSLLESK